MLPVVVLAIVKVTARLYTHRWLMLKHRNEEALQVLSMINQKSDVDPNEELEDLKMARTDKGMNCREFLKWKYFSRYVTCSTNTSIVIIH